MNTNVFPNPFRPGAGHPPPYLAGRDEEKQEFLKLLSQETILDNLIITGLRGVGKTVLLESLKPLAVRKEWAWVGADISESVSITEDNMAIRLLTDLSILTSHIVLKTTTIQHLGFTAPSSTIHTTLNYSTLTGIFNSIPGLASDKLKAVLELIWKHLQDTPVKGVIFAYDEAQNLRDQAIKEQHPLSILLDVFQSIQRKGVRFMLVLTGLPTLFPKLVDARTYSERMFRVLFLDRLDQKESIDAIQIPINKQQCPVKLSEGLVNKIVELSGGYPYFIQFICREVYDFCLQHLGDLKVPLKEIIHKLDTDFFSGRWSRATDRQRELLSIIASLQHCDQEFTVQEIVDQSRNQSEKPFSSSHVNQMLGSLSDIGLVYKNRYGKYSFAVPLLGEFIQRQKNPIY